jgi:capsid protein
MASVLTLLHEIGKYTDAAIVKKQIQTMFAAFLEKTAPDIDILPTDTSITATTGNPILCSLVHRSVNGDLWRGSDPA